MAGLFALSICAMCVDLNESATNMVKSPGDAKGSSI